MRHFGVEKFKALLIASTLAVAVDFMMTLFDIVIGGHLLGEQALAGIGLVNAEIMLITFFAMLLGAGTAINFARETGRCDPVRARQFFSLGLLSVVVLGLVLMLALGLGRDAYLSFMGPSAEVRVHAVAYWNGALPLAILTPLSVLLLECVQVDGNARLCIVASGVQIVVNIVASLVFCKIGLGAAGLSLASVAAYLVSVCILLTHLRSPANTLGFVRGFSVRDLGRICGTSLGDAASMLGTTAFALSLPKFMLARFGSDTLPAVAAALLTFEMSVVLDGVSSAIAPVVSVYSGEGNTRTIRDVMRVALRTSLLEGCALGLLLACFPGLVVSLCGIDDPAVVPAAKTAVRCVALGFPAVALVVLLNSYYLFISREGSSIGITFLKYLGCDLPLLVLGGLMGGFVGAFAGVAMAPYVALALMALFIAWREGRDMVPLLLPRTREANLKVFNLELTPEAIVATSAAVADAIRAEKVDASAVNRAALIVEEAFMVVRERNKSARRLLGEVTLDFNPPEDLPPAEAAKAGRVRLILRDDGEIFDITDADASITSLRAYLVASIMERQAHRLNLTTSGFNRNIFRF